MNATRKAILMRTQEKRAGEWTGDGKNLLLRHSSPGDEWLRFLDVGPEDLQAYLDVPQVALAEFF